MEALFTLISALIGIIYLTCVVGTKSGSWNEERKADRPRKRSKSVHRPVTPLELTFEASYEFALSILRAASGTENFVISPVSFGSALAILHDGAKDETKGELTRLLGKTLTPIDISSLYSSLTSSLLAKKSGVTTTIVNQIYLNEEFSLNADYQSLIEKMYNASCKKINFKDGNSCAKDANLFVNESTKGMIPDLVTADDFADSAAVLINAVSFKGEWEKPFLHITATSSFYGINGVRSERFMRASLLRSLHYLDDDITALSLEYKDPDYSLLVMMPSSDNFEEWRNNLTAMKIQETKENLRMGKINLELPKWKIESSSDGKKILEKCGVTRIFDDKRADLSGIAEELFISTIVHKAVIEVNEEGTVAAAATGVRLRKRGVGTPTVDIKFDKPFFYLLFKGRNILFTGQFC